jgi:hypothetical protein
VDFGDLWEQSRFFRAIFKSKSVSDPNKAFILWCDRYPKLDWRLCGVDGCSRIAEESDRFCMDHIVKKRKQLPKWLILRGRLFRFSAVRIGHAGETRAHDYIDYARTVSEKMLGPLRMGYEIYFVDGNPLNCHRHNLLYLSHISRAAMNNVRLPLSTAVQIDGRIDDLISGRKGRAQSAAIVSYGNIAKAIGLTQNAVRMAVNRGELSMADSDSVLEYILKKVEERRC